MINTSQTAGRGSLSSNSNSNSNSNSDSNSNNISNSNNTNHNNHKEPAGRGSLSRGPTWRPPTPCPYYVMLRDIHVVY